MAISEKENRSLLADRRILGCKTGNPFVYDVCGQLISPGGFLHHWRRFEYHVLILVTEGTLYITTNEVPYTLGAGQYIFLKAGEEHFGHRSSDGKLSYLWVHFQADGAFEEVKQNEDALLEKYAYAFPEQFRVTKSGRVAMLFQQLMELSLEEKLYSDSMLDYALSLLMMEMTQEYVQSSIHKTEEIPAVILQVMEWIKIHYHQPFAVTEVAEEVGYQADYLSSLFKRSTGISMKRFTNQIRIKTAKALLSNYDISIKEAAYSCGFSDEKYFMKVFKQREGMTPTQYKNTFGKS